MSAYRFNALWIFVISSVTSFEPRVKHTHIREHLSYKFKCRDVVNKMFFWYNYSSSYLRFIFKFEIHQAPIAICEIIHWTLAKHIQPKTRLKTIMIDKWMMEKIECGSSHLVHFIALIIRFMRKMLSLIVSFTYKPDEITRHCTVLMYANQYEIYPKN